MRIQISSLIFVLIPLASAELRGITIKGKIVCKSVPVETDFKFYEHDFVIDCDANWKTSNSQGEFEVSEKEDEAVGKFDPYIEIRHNCTQKPGCYQRSVFYYKTYETNRLVENEVLNLDDQEYYYNGPICY